MGLQKLQDVINEKTKGKIIDITKYLRKNPDEIMGFVRINNEMKEVNLSKYASDTLVDFNAGGRVFKDKKKIDSYANFEWEQYQRMGDDVICSSASAFKVIYDSLKAQKIQNQADHEQDPSKPYVDPFGGNEAAADDAIEYIQCRLQVIASPIYSKIDPDAFDNVPSNVFADIALDPDVLESPEYELYSEQDNEINLNDLADFTRIMAQMQSLNEKQAAARANEFITEYVTQTVGKAGQARLALMKKGISENEKKKLNETLLECQRDKIGYGMALVQLNNAKLHNLNDIMSFADKDRIHQLVENLTSEQISAISEGAKNVLDLGINAHAILGIDVNKEAEIEPLPEHQIWFESFKKQLIDMGYNSPMALAMIHVNDHIDTSEALGYDYSVEDSLKALNLLDNAIHPAFMPVDENGNLAISRNGENYVDWINNLSYANLDVIPEEHIKYLYNMAKENKLYLRSDDFEKIGYEKNRYFRVNEDGSSYLSKDMFELSGMLQSAQEGEKVDGYTQEELKALQDYDAKMMAAESEQLRLITGTIAMTENEADKKLLEDKLISNLGIKDACAKAHRHPEWFADENTAKKLFDVHKILRKTADRITNEDEQLRSEYPVIAGAFDTIEKKLLKESDLDTIEELFAARLITDESGAVIEGTDSLDFAVKVSNALFKGNAVLLGDKAFVFNGMYMSEGFVKGEYENEIKSLSTDIENYAQKLTGMHVRLDEFGEACNELQRVMKQSNYTSFNVLETAMNNMDYDSSQVLKDIRDKVVAGEKLSPADIDGIKLVYKFRDLKRKIDNKEQHPGQSLDYDIATRLYNAAAIESGNFAALVDDDMRKEGIALLTDNENVGMAKFAALNINEKKAMLAKPDSELLKSGFINDNIKGYISRRGHLKIEGSSQVPLEILCGTDHTAAFTGVYPADIMTSFKTNVVDGLFGTKEKYLDNLMNAPEMTARKCLNFYTSYQRTMKQSDVINVLQQTFPGYTAPSEEEFAENVQLTEDFRRKYHDAYTRNVLVRDYALNKIGYNGEVPRRAIWYTDGDLSIEGLKRNTEFLRKYLRGTDEEKIECIETIMDKMVGFDLTKFDLNNPESIMDNMDEFARMINYGAEAGALLADARNLGMDLSQPQYREFVKKAEALSDFGMLGNAYVNMYCSNGFAYFGDVHKPELTGFNMLKNIPGSNDTYYSVLGLEQSPFYMQDRSLARFFEQCSVANMFASPFDNPALDTKKRLDTFYDLKKDTLQIKYAEGIAPQLRKPENKYYVSEDADLNRMFDRSALYTDSSYSSASSFFNPMLTCDFDRLYKMVDGKLVKAMPDGFGEPPLVDTADLTDEMLKDIYTSGDYYIFAPGATDPRHIHDGIVDQKVTKGLTLASPRFLSQNEKEIHELETDIFNDIRMSKGFHDLYGQKLDNVGDDAYKSYVQKISSNALQVDANLVYPQSNLSDLDMQALTCFSYGDLNVTGDFHLYGEPESNAYAALQAGPNDLYIQRNGNAKIGERPLNTFIKTRIATRKIIEAYNNGNSELMAETIARSIYNIGMSAASCNGMTPTAYSQTKAAEMAYNFITSHKEILDLARSKAQTLGGDALEKFDMGVENCKRAHLMREIYQKGREAKYRLALYKDDRFVGPDGKIYKITNEEKKSLEKDLLISDVLAEATKNQMNTLANNPEAKQIVEQANHDMFDLDPSQAGMYTEGKQALARWIAEKDLDPFVEALSDEAAMKVALEKGKNAKEIRAYAVFEHLKNQIKAHPEKVQKTPEFIRNMAQLRFAIDKIEAKKPLDLAIASVQDNPDMTVAFFNDVTEDNFAQQCIGFMEEPDPEQCARIIRHGVLTLKDMNKGLSYYTDGSPYQYTKGLFMPKTDGSGMRMHFSNPATDKMFADIQKEIDSVEIEVPEGLTNTDVAMATMGIFFDPAVMIQSLNEVSKMHGSTMNVTGNALFDAEAAIENFLQNSLDNDDRPNMHDSRKYVPAARRKCQEVMREYVNGNHKPFVDAVHQSFETCFNRMMSTTMFDDARFAFCSQTITNDINILQREGYQFTDRELDFCNNLLIINNTAREVKELEKGLFRDAVNKAFTKDLKLGDDPEYKERFDRYVKLRALMDDTKNAVKSMQSAIVVSNDQGENNRRYNSRDLTAIERGFLDKENMMEAIFQTTIAGTEKYAKLYDKPIAEFILSPAIAYNMNKFDAGSYSVDLAMENRISFMERVNTNEDLRGNEYTRFKVAVNQFVENFKEIKNNPAYKHEDLFVLSESAKKLSDLAGKYLEDGLDKKDFILLISSAADSCTESSIKNKISGEKQLQEVVDKFNELTGVEKIVAKEARPGIINEEDLDIADAWFASFSEQLKGIGISYDNPLSLALVKEVDPNIDFRAQSDLLHEDERNLTNKVKAIKLVDKKISMAFGNDRLRKYPYYGNDYANHLCKNIVDPLQMSPEEKYRLYISAKNGNLIISNPSADPGAEQNFRKVRVLENGSAQITAPLNPVPVDDFAKKIAGLDPEAKAAAIADFEAEYGFKYDTYNQEGRELALIGEIIQSGQVDLSEIKSQLDDKYTKFENGKEVPKTAEEQKQFDGEMDAYTEPVRWTALRHKLITRSMQMGSIFKDEASRKKLSELVRVNSIPKSIRTEKEQETYDRDFLFRSVNEQLFTTLMKKFNVNSIDNIPVDRIRDKNGNAFGEAANYKTLNNLAKATFNADPIMIDNQMLVFSANNAKFIDAVNLDEYAKESAKLLKELNKTNSIFSQDTEAYTKFNEALKTMVDNIEELRKAETADSKTVPTVMAEFANAKNYCTRYINEHKIKEELSTRQINRLGVMDKFLNLYSKLNNKVYAPSNITERLAEDLTVEITKQFLGTKDKRLIKQAKDALLDSDKMKERTEAFKQDKVFQSMLTKGDGYLKELLTKSPDKLLKEYVKAQKDYVKQEELARNAEAVNKGADQAVIGKK